MHAVIVPRRSSLTDCVFLSNSNQIAALVVLCRCWYFSTVTVKWMRVGCSHYYHMSSLTDAMLLFQSLILSTPTHLPWSHPHWSVVASTGVCSIAGILYHCLYDVLMTALSHQLSNCCFTVLLIQLLLLLLMLWLHVKQIFFKIISAFVDVRLE